MELWKKKLIEYMQKYNLSNSETIERINANGGKIKQSGFTHWLNNEEPNEDGIKSRKSKPGIRNTIAIKKMIGDDFKLESIYNGEETKG